MDLFELITKEKFEINQKRIITYIIKNNTLSDLLISPEIHSFVINGKENTKYLRANKRYIIDTYLKVLLDENSEANIIVTEINNEYIYTINKTNPIFENKIYTNSSVLLVSDKDALLFIYHHLDEKKQKNIVFPKNGEGKLILFNEDCTYS